MPDSKELRKQTHVQRGINARHLGWKKKSQISKNHLIELNLIESNINRSMLIHFDVKSIKIY